MKNQNFVNTEQFWDKANLHAHTLEGEAKTIFKERQHDFQDVDFQAWIDRIKAAREKEIRLAAAENDEYSPQDFVSYDPLLRYLGDKLKDFEALKDEVLED